MSSSPSHLSAEARASLPQHVAVIMDGNGRWAKQHGLPRVEGHRVGAESARTIIRTAGELGIKYLTLYAFSAENWNRPKDEVDALMKYLIHYLKRETPELNKSGVRLEAIGQIHRLPEHVQEHLRKSIATLSKNNGLTLVMALSYGSRIEIVEAVRAIAEKVKKGKLETADIDEKVISDNLWTRNLPDPDLLIRTSGEMRVSNFLLWQISTPNWSSRRRSGRIFASRNFFRFSRAAQPFDDEKSIVQRAADVRVIRRKREIDQNQIQFFFARNGKD